MTGSSSSIRAVPGPKAREKIALGSRAFGVTEPALQAEKRAFQPGPLAREKNGFPGLRLMEPPVAIGFPGGSRAFGPG